MREPFVQDADFTLYVGDVREVLRDLGDESVHCVVTSPPYWGLRDYGSEGQIGLEATPDEYVAALVEVFREVRRVLRRDGTCWLNLGDSYAVRGQNRSDDYIERTGGNTGFNSNNARTHEFAPMPPGLKQKDLVGIPWRVAFALQADGWYLRSDIIWAKPNPMPESVTDRPTKAHEYLFLLTRSARYFYDADAIREPAEWARWGDQTNGKHEGQQTSAGWIKPKTREELNANRSSYKPGSASNMNEGEHVAKSDAGLPLNPLGRNARSVWEIATQPYAQAHFATFPEELPRRCIAAGTSEHGCCPECGAPWERLTETTYEPSKDGGKRGRVSDGYDKRGHHNEGVGERARRIDTTVGWGPTCQHGDGFGVIASRFPAPVPCVVLDPFMGSGTTALVARKLGRKSIGIELNPDYAELAARRLSQQSLLA